MPPLVTSRASSIGEFRTMRRTVTTLIDRTSGDTDAAAQLGHAATAVTRRYYIAARAASAPDLTEILERFSGAESGD